jgi:hypothetical protein
MAKNRPKTIEIQNYYDALRNEFLLSATRSTALSHLGERGRNEELRVRKFLEGVLPARFSVGSGFVVSSNKALGHSPQMDVIIYDNVFNAAIFREVSADVYPIEMVYAVIEVKRLLQKKDLPKILRDIKHIRALGEQRWYVAYTSLPNAPDVPNQRVSGRIEFPLPNPKPRSYVVAFRQKGWADLPALREDVISALEQIGGHIHGMVVLEPDWYLTLEAFTPPRAGVKAETGGSLLSLVHNVLHSVGSMPMFPASIDRYLRAATEDSQP